MHTLVVESDQSNFDEKIHLWTLEGPASFDIAMRFDEYSLLWTPSCRALLLYSRRSGQAKKSPFYLLSKARRKPGWGPYLVSSWGKPKPSFLLVR